ncbi:MAG: cyclophilin-like fold protein, partial [Lachnospiraceae bacterium]
MEIRYRTWIIMVLAAALLIFTAGCGGGKSESTEQVQSQSASGTGQDESQSASGTGQDESQSASGTGQVQSQSTAGTGQDESQSASDTEADKSQSAETADSAQTQEKNSEHESSTQEEVSEQMMQMKIGGTIVEVEWEDNESVEALKDLCKDEPLKIEMSMYGGFEQVGSLGSKLP